MLLRRGGAVVRQQWARSRSGSTSAAVQVVVQSLPRYASTSAAASASRSHNDDYTIPTTTSSSPSSSMNPRGKGKERALEYSDGTPRQPTEKEREMQEAAASFERLGLNAKLSKQLVAAFYPSIRSPTSTQQAILSAVRQNSDMIIRAHTGTGKSFGLLLALLSKPRIVMREKTCSPSGDGAGEETSIKSKRIASIVVVPSQELAKQYERWARQLFPASLHHTLPSALAVKFREKGVSTEQHLDDLLDNPPHILVITAGLLNDLLTAHGGASVLGINTLRTLVLDEVDALLSLPGRFPSAKLVWNHLKHPPDGLEALNKIMKSRATFSGGEPLPSMGLEKKKTTSSPTSSGIRRRVHQGNDLLRERASSRGKGDFTLSPPRTPLTNERPLQLIAASATANSVLRHFLGARTGWLRTGLREGENRSETGKWLDMTGLSQGINKAAEVTNAHGYSQSGWAFQLPKELKHSCIVVDEPSGQGIGEEAETNWRELKPKVVRNSRSNTDAGEGKGKKEVNKIPGKPAGPIIVTPAVASSPSLDEHLLLCLAFQFASQPVSRGLALIPAGWSLTKARSFLAALDIPVRFLNEPEKSTSIINEESGEQEGESPPLYLIQANSVRGIDVPGGVSHVFCLGIESVQDAVNYTHLAGRASRIGGQNLDTSSSSSSERSHTRPPGHVITLLRGVNADQARQNQRANKLLTIASSELKMSLIYKSLDLRPQKMDADEESLRYAQIREEEEGREEGEVEEVAAEVEAEEGETKEEVAAEVDEVLEEEATETEPEKETESEKEPPSASIRAAS